MIADNLSLDDMPNEKWLDVDGYIGKYKISSMGRLKSLSRECKVGNNKMLLPNKILKQKVERNGYLRYKSLSIHRLVALAFIPQVAGKEYVNHINGNKLDNRACNLEWCTCSENIMHAWNIGLMNDQTRAIMSSKAKMRTGIKNSCWRGYVDIFDKELNYITRVNSMVEAEGWIKNNTNFDKASKSNICRVCSGKLNSAYGYIFRLAEED